MDLNAKVLLIKNLKKEYHSKQTSIKLLKTKIDNLNEEAKKICEHSYIIHYRISNYYEKSTNSYKCKVCNNYVTSYEFNYKNIREHVYSD